MSFVHCHACGWQQDDFWEWRWTWKFWKSRAFGYNPVSLIIDDFRSFWRPRIIKVNYWLVKDPGLKTDSIFSWHILVLEVQRHIGLLFSMRWWTYHRYKKSRNKNCPNCQSHLCID